MHDLLGEAAVPEKDDPSTDVEAGLVGSDTGRWY
jgi:hypothetical protein